MELLIINAIVFIAFCGLLLWAKWRTQGDAKFPGPAPVGSVFKKWFVVIWLVGGVLPLAAIIWDGLVQGQHLVWLALGPYFLMFIAQIATELFVWRRWQSPVWVIVPCLYLPWRLYQIVVAHELIIDYQPLLTALTLDALFVLWAINIGVHFTNIPNTLRWKFHAADSNFPSLEDARVIVGNKD